MSSLLYGRAKRIKVGDRSAKLFLLILCDYADENNRAWPSIDRLMAEGEASASTVQRALRYLEDHGLITRDEDYGTRYAQTEAPTSTTSPSTATTTSNTKTVRTSKPRKNGVAPVTPRQIHGVAPMTPRNPTTGCHP